MYVTDLDGTLMRNDETLSAYTIETINDLIAKGHATGIIGCNEEDAVANYLKERMGE
ncbi:MAG: HAD hydrolase family protein [Lachnospiraceae bacterium]|nr:HAD hydrolase family protein [Lachnospiraceae bacterium]